MAAARRPGSARRVMAARIGMPRRWLGGRARMVRPRRTRKPVAVPVARPRIEPVPAIQTAPTEAPAPLVAATVPAGAAPCLIVPAVSLAIEPDDRLAARPADHGRRAERGRLQV